jgi:phosphoglycerol transferase MdoB-like AlkP superfamily enzyme
MAEKRFSAGDMPARPRRSERRRKTSTRRTGDYFLIALIALALVKTQLSRALGLGDPSPLGIAFEAAAVVLILASVDLLFRRRSYTVDLICYSLLSFVMLANVMYVTVFGQVFSPHMLSVVGQATDVADSIQALLKPIYLAYFIDIPLLAAWAIASWRVRRKAPDRERKQVALVAAVALVVLCAQIASVLTIATTADARQVAAKRGFGVYQLGSLVREVLPDPAIAASAAFAHEKGMTPAQAAQAEIDRLRHARSGERIGDFKPGEYRGKNVIVIQVEALQDFVIGKEYGGQEITPNLNRLVDSSWYFPETFSQSSAGNTVDAEFVVNTSLLPPVAGASSVDYSDREIPALPRLFREQGYDAITLHANDIRFWNRRELYPALGFRRWWDKSYFQNRDKMWHASDQVLFEMTMPVLKEERAAKKPFYSFVITESSHSPFRVIPPRRRPLRLSPAEEKTLGGRYIGSISYTDKAIGEFVASLKKSGLWDESIVIIYGDHSALLDAGPNRGDADITNKILGRTYSDVDRQRIPLIVHLPGQTKPRVEYKPVGQVDIMPTIADLVGLDLSKAPHLGRSVFVDAPALVSTRAFLPGGSFVDDRMLFMPGLAFEDGSAHDIETGRSLTPGDAERRDYDVVKRLTIISDAWVKSLPERPDAQGVKGALIPH